MTWAGGLAAALLLLLAGALAAEPVTLTQISSRVVLLGDGSARITYSIAFRENEEGREQLRDIGPLLPAHTIESVTGEGPAAKAFAVSLEDKGGGHYRVALGERTREDETYKITIITARPAVVDTSEYQGKRNAVLTGRLRSGT
jgi:hypothetical protein